MNHTQKRRPGNNGKGGADLLGTAGSAASYSNFANAATGMGVAK